MEQRSFASPEEEIQYLKNRVKVLEKESKDIKDEFDEFQEGSRELEHELETQLEQSEAKIKDFRSLTNRLQHENDQLKDKLEQCHKEYHFQVRFFWDFRFRPLVITNFEILRENTRYDQVKDNLINWSSATKSTIFK